MFEQYELESNTLDYLDLGIPGIKSHKIKNENTIIIHFHSGENRTSCKLGLIQAIVYYAKYLQIMPDAKSNKIIVFTCHSSSTNLGEWIRKNTEIIPVDETIYWHIENKTLYIGEKSKDISMGMASERALKINLSDEF